MDIAVFAEHLRSLWAVWLMVLFVAIIGWAFWPRNKDRLNSYADIPLRDDDDQEGR